MINNHMTDQQHTFALELLTRLPALAPGATVLDIGAGPGYQTQWFREQGYNATAVDLSAPLVDVPYVTADAHALPFTDESVDAVWTHHAFEHMRDPLGALLEVNRVLRPDGHLFFTVPDTDGVVSSGHITRYDKALVAYHLAMCGFKGDVFRVRSHLRATARRVERVTSLDTNVWSLMGTGRLPKWAADQVRATGRFR